MLKKKLGKKALAFASAAVMAVSATATGLTALSMTAFAGEELGEGTFENGKGLPWHICENATAVMKFDITDGIYAIKLENIGGTANGGESRWDCQFRHRNLTIESGHTYRITYSVNPSNSGHMYPKLGNMSKDDQELWHSNGDELSLSYEEGLTQEQLDALAQFDTPTICNAIEGFGVRCRTEGFTRPELRMRAAMSDKPMVGYARTGVISARQPATPAHSAVMEAYYRQYEDFDLPMVAAIQDLDRVPVGSFWGDVQATVHRALGCIGVITDGGVRDIEEVKRVGFYLFSKEVLISHAYIHMVEAGTAVDICGMTVRPGDLIHADAHGAIVIPQEIAGQLAEACVRAMDAEEALKGPCQAAIARGERVTAKEIMAWRGEMQRRRAAIAPKQEHL